jgi:hypothetical protein
MKSIRRGDTSIYGAIVIAFLIIIATSMFFNYIAALRNYQNNLSSSLSTILSTINAEVKFTPSGTTITITSDRYLEIIGIIAYNQSGTQYINISLGKPLAAISPTNQLDISTIVPSNIVSQVLGGNTYIAILASNGMLYTYKASSSGSGSSDLASILLNGDICSLLSDPVQRIACYINNRIYNDNASNYLVYAYGAVMQSYTTIEKVGVYFAEAPIQFTNPIATSIYSWSYSKYIGYTTWGGNYSIVVAGFYGSHGTCRCTRYDGFIFLEAGVTYTVVVRHQQTGGGRALGLYLMPPGTATWIPMDSSWSSKLSSYASISNITMTAYSWPGGYANSYRDFSIFFYSNPASFWSGSIGYIWFAGGGVNLNPPTSSDFPFANIKGENFATQTVFTITPYVAGVWGFAIDSDDAADVIVVLPIKNPYAQTSVSAEIQSLPTTTWGGNIAYDVAHWYGGHGTSRNPSHNGYIYLISGLTYKIVVRHEQGCCGRAIGLYIMPPGSSIWIPMNSQGIQSLRSYAEISQMYMKAFSWNRGHPSSWADFDSFFFSNPPQIWSGSVNYIWFAGGGVNLNPPAESDFPFANIKGENFGDYIEFTLTLLVDGMWGFAVDSDDASDVLVVLPSASFSYIDERSMLDFAVRVVGIMALNDYKGLVGRVFASQILPGHVAQKILYYMADSNMFDELIYVLTSIEGTYGGSTNPWDTVLYVKSILNNPYTTYILDAPYVVVARNISGVTIKNSWGYSAPAELRPRSFGAGSMVVLASTAWYSNVISDPNNLRDSMGNLRPVYGGPNGFMPSIAYNEQIYRGSGSGGGQGGPATCSDTSGTYVFYGSPGYTTVYDNPVDAIDFLKRFFKYASDIWIRYALGKSISSITSIPVYGGSRGGYGARGFYDYIYGSGGGGGGGLAILYATYSYGNIVSSPGGLGGPSYIVAGSACYGSGDGYPGQPGLAVVYYRYGNAQADLRIMMTN